MANEADRRYRVAHVGTGLTGREALRAVRYFRDACRKEEASASLAREVLTFIRHVEWHPQRKFAAV